MSLRKMNSATKIVLGFLAVILVGTFLLMLPLAARDGQWFPFVDALFTATSAVCVTGLSVVDLAVHFTAFGQLVVLLLIQIGGLGFITLTCLVFLLIGKKITYTERKTIQESLNQENVQGIVSLVIKIVILVGSVELLGFLCLAPSMIISYGWWRGLFKALFLAVSAFCNAGFDVLGTPAATGVSLTNVAQNVLVLLPIMMLIVVGGIGFMVLFDLGNRFRKQKLSLHTKITLIVTGILILLGAGLFALLEWNNTGTIGDMSVGGKILNAFFHSVTTRTAGFYTFDYANLTTGSIVLTCVLMLIGGGSASTAGGIKITTLVCLLLLFFKKTNQAGDIIIYKKRISNKILIKCVKIVGIALLLVLLATLGICVLEGNQVTLAQVVFETVSAISTCGLSMGITASLSAASHLILCLLMFVGRVGPLTLTLAMSAKISNNAPEIQYPNAKIMVG